MTLTQQAIQKITSMSNSIKNLITTHNNDSTAHNDIRTNLNNKIDKSITSGLVKNDGTIDTNTYLKDITVISDEEDIINDGIYLEIESNNNVVATVIGNSIKLGNGGNQWLSTTGDVIINWGDGTSDTVSNPNQELSHTYTDGASSHNIRFIGEVTSLGAYCFDNCTGLTSVTIPNTVTSIGNYCFRKCTGLTSISIPNSVTSLGNSCFADCTGLTSITISNSITSLASACFSDCTGLTSITIPNSVTSLGDDCFAGCNGLTSISIPNLVTSLGAHCFNSCTSLTSVTIPNSVTSLGSICFYYCSALIDYQLYWTNNNIITYNSYKMPNNTNSIFTIPVGETANYVAKGYPSDKLQERSE